MDSTTHDSAELMAQLRSQRDRFVAFAFAAADLLVELRNDGTVAYVAGAAQNVYGGDTARLAGTPFCDLLDPADRGIAKALIGSLERSGRFVPVAVRLARPGTGRVILGGCRLPNRKDAVFLSLALAVNTGPEAPEAQTVLSREDFAARATQRLLTSDAADLKLTLVAFDELESLQARLGAEEGVGLAAAVERYLYGCSAGVEAAGALGSGRYGLLHSRSFDGGRLQEGVETLSKAVDPEGRGITLRTSTMELDKGGLDVSDAARALVYCLNDFANSEDGSLSIPTLREGLDKALAKTVARVSDFRTTVADRAFSLVYQPIVDLRSRKTHHFEALARFSEDDSPGNTVAFAEAVRLIADFDLAVCEQVLAELRGRQRDSGVTVAVNLSGRSVESSVFMNSLFALLQHEPEMSRRLLFEITESAVITRTEEVNGRIQALRSDGFAVCLDDFGAGANAFNYLRSFEVDYVKIDGAFMRAALKGARDRTLLRSVAGFCKDVKVATIAEMIETEAEAEALEQLGIAYGQGFLFGRPLPSPYR